QSFLPLKAIISCINAIEKHQNQQEKMNNNSLLRLKSLFVFLIAFVHMIPITEQIVKNRLNR
ncbi:MAG: hypothetical protein KAJ86_06210, partial [Alphaproteobacteria bacterium]|nr:hypothetical protein [Alphaproteobacteria bacterium]